MNVSSQQLKRLLVLVERKEKIEQEIQDLASNGVSERRRQQGRYMGLLRVAKPDIKKAAKAALVTGGIDAALKLLTAEATH